MLFTLLFYTLTKNTSVYMFFDGLKKEVLNKIIPTKKYFTVSQIVSFEMGTSNILNRKSVLSLIKNDFLECHISIPKSKREAPSDPGMTNVEGYVRTSNLTYKVIVIGRWLREFKANIWIEQYIVVY